MAFTKLTKSFSSQSLCFTKVIAFNDFISQYRFPLLSRNKTHGHDAMYREQVVRSSSRVCSEHAVHYGTIWISGRRVFSKLLLQNEMQSAWMSIRLILYEGEACWDVIYSYNHCMMSQIYSCLFSRCLGSSYSLLDDKLDSLCLFS